MMTMKKMHAMPMGRVAQVKDSDNPVRRSISLTHSGKRKRVQVDISATEIRRHLGAEGATVLERGGALYLLSEGRVNVVPGNVLPQILEGMRSKLQAEISGLTPVTPRRVAQLEELKREIAVYGRSVR